MTPINSMTGFASGQGAACDFSWTWEMRSVNAKGLDLRLRVPDWIEGLEVELRKVAVSRLKRGNVTLNLRLARQNGDSGMQLNTGQLERVLVAMAEIEQHAMNQGLSLAPSTASEIVGMRGMMDAQEPQADSATLKSILLKEFQSVMDSFCEMRGTEGAALQQVLINHLTDIETLVCRATEAAETRRPKSELALKIALQRVLDIASELDENRLLQELALLSVKADITEEIKRLEAHVVASHELISSGGIVGRKLDFLMQEFNREANTLCSKSGDSALTAIGLDLKAVIDQLREQVQNVE